MSTFLFLAMLCSVNPGRVDLTGRIVDQQGKTVQGANVFVQTCDPRVGIIPQSRSSYTDISDWSKSTVTTTDGSFMIHSLDSSLLFGLLVVADGFRPTRVNRVDPLLGPIEAKLNPLDLKALDPRQYIRGRVLSPDGSPIAGARLVPTTTNGTAYVSGALDPIAVTSLRGEFVLVSKSAFDKIWVKVSAPNLASKVFPELTTANPGHDLQMVRGARVTGQVVRDDKPLPNVVVGLVQTDRGHVRFLRDKTVAANHEGRFLFSNVSPNDRYFVYGVIDSLRPFGSLPATELKVGDDGTTTDVGQLKVVPGHRLAGQVFLSDGKRIPPYTRLSISRQQGWDGQIVEVDQSGRFMVEDLPTEEYTVSGEITGYHLSRKNASLDALWPYWLRGRIDSELKNVIILYDPGEPRRTFWRREDQEKLLKTKVQPIAGVSPETGR
jgi:hypothetical protein